MANEQPHSVTAASILCFLWGIVLLLVAGASAAPMFSGHRFAIAGAMFPLIVLLVALAYCVTGYLIGRRRRLGAWLGLTIGTLTLLLQPVIQLDIMYISLKPGWIIVDTLLLAVLLASWRRFDQPAGGR